ncbi:MAG: hypothetical protein E7463_07605 [Ruminococcaceae bacterium]|nr:hypothetical protein [Oscillospiraceae bacterium]
MIISTTCGEAVFCTPYSDQYDLLQFFRGILKGTNAYNCPVSFHTAGLRRRTHNDEWHIDTVLSFATDECVPQKINGEYIGANHAWPAGVVVFLPDHGKTVADVGSLWKDEAGLSWTLMRIGNEENLIFLSENIGESKVIFDFAREITGKLTYVSHGVHTDDIVPVSQHGGAQMSSANRYLKRSIYAYKDGKRFLVYGGAYDVDCGEIVEEYEIINPATVADALRAGRPEGGYTTDPDLAVGEAMLHHSIIYRILGDGTMLVIFDHKRLQDVRWYGNMGIMYQEKNNVGNGGVWRVIPTLKPVEYKGKSYDFRVPYNTTDGEFPNGVRLTADLWENPEFPPDHQLDFIRRADGSCVAAFAGGYLPVYDGVPSVRIKNIDSAAMMVASRKTYPNFSGEYIPRGTAVKDMPTHDRSKGVAYRRYFAPEKEGACVNAYEYEGTTYVVMDFYGERENTLTYVLPEGSACQMVSSYGVELRREGDVLVGKGKQGTALIAVG